MNQSVFGWNSQELIRYGKLVAVGGLGVALNVLLHYINKKEQKTQIAEIQQDLTLKRTRSLKRRASFVQKTEKWGKFLLENPVEDNDLLQQLKLMSHLMAEFEKIPNLIVDQRLRQVDTHRNPLLQYGNKTVKEQPFMDPNSLTDPGAFVINTSEVRTSQLLYYQKKWLRAGPRAHIYFDPKKVRAAVVTGGGLCPGINVVVKQIVQSLRKSYGVPEVSGILFSFKGFKDFDWIQLSLDYVKAIHHAGGSCLGMSRAKADPIAFVDILEEKGINQLYVLGGLGTLAVCNQMYQEIKSRQLEIGICALAKSITNQIPIVDRSFGFQTAVEQVVRAIDAAYVQSHSHEGGIAIVKVTGRNTGFLNMEACLAARNVSVCLVPEFEFDLGGELGLLNYIKYRINNKKNTLITVCEGCSDSVRDYHIQTIGQTVDGQPIKQDIGVLLVREIQAFLIKNKIQRDVKYINPAYIVRTVQANTYDSKLCSELAISSVHGMMCGYTGFMAGLVTNTNVMIPLQEILSGNYENHIMRYSQSWQRLLASTGQPSLINPIIPKKWSN